MHKISYINKNNLFLLLSISILLYKNEFSSIDIIFLFKSILSSSISFSLINMKNYIRMIIELMNE